MTGITTALCKAFFAVSVEVAAVAAIAHPWRLSVACSWSIGALNALRCRYVVCSPTRVAFPSFPSAASA